MLAIPTYRGKGLRPLIPLTRQYNCAAYARRTVTVTALFGRKTPNAIEVQICVTPEGGLLHDWTILILCC